MPWLLAHSLFFSHTDADSRGWKAQLSGVIKPTSDMWKRHRERRVLGGAHMNTSYGSIGRHNSHRYQPHSDDGNGLSPCKVRRGK